MLELVQITMHQIDTFLRTYKKSFTCKKSLHIKLHCFSKAFRVLLGYGKKKSYFSMTYIQNISNVFNHFSIICKNHLS